MSDVMVISTTGQRIVRLVQDRWPLNLPMPVFLEEDSRAVRFRWEGRQFLVDGEFEVWERLWDGQHLRNDTLGARLLTSLLGA
ncbi:MAG: hypothetical protein A3J48_02890 [Candidatus Doudnabacteria bacterium RIFCSPHIGHO2_02_FULL_46_11]|uniref:Uncharacterized protein n=1 Tax=Candidatus Doudnabacteria bacterium RIFCSPHIGHO2_02_FULL_46_11 TaxID=1817832 RepID=A0A1F5P5F1_9BACT|nr:MAG: hypothetical protein A3J48_02890 [Candidatus Doudnabacteria bacterium RIFCSPHIGHO2_02_FULL_46_11]